MIFGGAGHIRARLAAVILVLLIASSTSVEAQSDPLNWTEPERIWGYEDRASPPFMVADQNRTVHAMNSREGPGGAVAGIDITYRRWNLDQGWTEPVDVIISPRSDIALIRGLMLDAEGFLHVVFYGGNEQGASIYYSYAPAIDAANAQSWSAPTEIDPFAGPVSEAAMVGDGAQKLFVVFTGYAEEIGAYATYSLDGGLNWSEPVKIHQSAAGQWPTHYAMLLDRGGRVHVAWSEADATGNGLLLYYARLDENQSAWSTADVIDEVTEYEVDTPSLFEYDDELHLVYHNDFPTTHWLRTSSDQGMTWSNPQRLFELIGGNGPISYVEDSAGTVHAFFGNRTGDSSTHGMWHSIYSNGRFSKPVAVISGPKIADGPGGNSFDPTYANAVVVQGNTVLLTWRSDDRQNGVHYTLARINSPEFPVVPLAPINVESPPSPTSTPSVAEPTSTPLPIALRQASPAPSSGSSTGLPLILGLLSALVLLVTVLLLRLKHRAA